MGTLRVTELLTTSLRGLWDSGNPVTGQWRTERKGHHVFSVRRHLTKNRPGLPQKSSETPSTVVVVKRGRGPKDSAAQTLNGAYSCSVKVVAATACTRAGSSWLQFFPQTASSNPGLVTLTQDASIPASSRLRAVGVTASPHFYDGFDAVLARRR